MLKLLKSKKFLVCSALMLLTLALGCVCFASGDSLSSSLDFSPITEAVTSLITPTDIIIVIAGVIGAGMGFILAWFGIRKVVNALRNAILRGRLKV